MPDHLLTRQRRPLPRAVVNMCILMVALTLLSVVFELIVHFFHLQIDAAILSSASDRFGDFTIYQPKFLLFHQPNFYQTGFPFTYPAPVALVYEFFFSLFGSYALPVFLIFCALAFLVPTYFFAEGLVHRGITRSASFGLVAFLLMTSWPMILVIDRGNMEVLVWLALVGAMYAYSTGKGYSAACLFGLAAALKLFPFVFLALFYSRRQWGKLLAGTVVFLGVSIISLKILGPSLSVASNQITTGLDFFRLNYMAQWHTRENGVDHSIFSFYKFLSKLLQRHRANDFRLSLAIYLRISAFAGVALYFARIRKLPILNQVLCLSIASIYFTAFSGDGTLLHLYYPTALLIFLAIRAQGEGRVVPGLSLALLLLGFILSITTFVTWGRQILEGEAKCVALGALLIVALTKPFGLPLTEQGAVDLAATPVPDAGAWSLGSKPLAHMN